MRAFVDNLGSIAAFVFFFNDTATTEIYTLSLHDALPILTGAHRGHRDLEGLGAVLLGQGRVDRKSTRLNSSHGYISYAVFCLKKTTYCSIDTSVLIILFSSCILHELLSC